MKEEKKKRYVIGLHVFGCWFYLTNLKMKPFSPGRNRNKNSTRRRNFKYRIFQSQQGKCACCGRELPIDEMQLHHILPRSIGGKDGFENEIGLCNDCHQQIHYNPVFYGEAIRKHVEQHPEVLQEGESIETLEQLQPNKHSRVHKKHKQWCFGPIKVTYGE